MENQFQKYLQAKTNRLRRKKKYNPKRLFLAVLALFVILFLISFTKKLIKNATTSVENNDIDIINEILIDETIDNVLDDSDDDSDIENNIESSLNNSEINDDEVTDPKIEAVINSYQNLGVISCNGYINFRSEPNAKNTRSIIGLMNNGDALDILEWDVKNNSTFCKVKSGGMTGYVAKQYVMTGNAAKNVAKNNVADRIIILVDKLRMRSSPTTNADNIVGTTYKGERYRLISVDNGWAKVHADNLEDVDTAYVSADNKYIEVKFCLSEARTQDLKSDVLNYYDNLGVATAKDWLNIRKTASDKSSIIGKLPGKAGCEILGETGNFYKIKSGKVTGYVSKQYLATGKKAEDLALQYADLRAIIKIPALRVRSAPSTKAKQWTTIRKEETYIVKNQLDGWVEIEIDEDSDKGYISTSKNYVEVRYALEQAIEFHPATTAGTSSLRTNIKNSAIRHIGEAYVWGGNKLGSGVDCSGFVQQIFKQYGVSLPRVSKEQAKSGVAVTSANKKVGDLVFYTNSNGVVDHVGIYIGNNQIVHAASTKAGIKISSWDYRTPHSIRNVLGNK